VTVAPTDTLDALAAKYDVNSEDILATNGLDDPNLVVGQVLVVPGAKGKAIPKPTSKPAAPRQNNNTTSRPSGGGGGSSSSVRPPSSYTGGKFLWPVVGGGNYVSQYFHYGHYAIDIAADYGSTVRAAAAGTVTFAGWKNNGGGYQVWIAHGSGLYTTYNHMSGVSVGRGEHVPGRVPLALAEVQQRDSLHPLQQVAEVPAGFKALIRVQDREHVGERDHRTLGRKVAESIERVGHEARLRLLAVRDQRRPGRLESLDGVAQCGIHQLLHLVVADGTRRSGAHSLDHVRWTRNAPNWLGRQHDPPRSL
jgi:hypothetical protein